MKAIAILGSPRVKMNTDTLLEKVILGLQKSDVTVEKVILKNLTIYPCISCNACAKIGTCFRKDDMTKIYDKFNESDIIIIASPLYFNSVTSITKAVIDRCQAFWSSKYILHQPTIDRMKKRKGLFICTAGAPQKEEGFIGATVVMDLFFKAINTQYEHNLFVDNTDKQFVGECPNILDKAFKLGIELARV